MASPFTVKSLKEEDAIILRNSCTVQIELNPDYHDGEKMKEILLIKYIKDLSLILAPIRTASSCSFYSYVPKKIDRTTKVPIELRDYQKKDLGIVLDKLEEKRTCMINMHTGYGKTILAIYISVLLRTPTLVITYGTKLRNQWKQKYEEFYPYVELADVGQIEEINNLPEFCVRFCGIDFLRKQIEKTSPSEHISIIRKLNNFKFVVIDEVHDRLCGFKTIKLLNFLTPDYMLGCSATPDIRPSVPKLLEPYFGPQEDYIERRSFRNFEVIRINTNISPVYDVTFKGKINWTNLLKSLAYNPTRQQMIYSEIKSWADKDKKMIVLSKFTKQLDDLAGLAQADNITHQKAYGPKKTAIDKNVQILFGIYSGIGTGFDDTTRQVAILCDNVANVTQYAGRIRNEDKTIVEFLDRCSMFSKHVESRKQFYVSTGANIIDR